MNLSTLAEWLSFIETQHPFSIDLGLDRVRVVAERLSLLHPAQAVITVGGTNGKGSTVAALEAIYLANGYQVGAFTSPFLLIPNEQIRINQKPVADAVLCEAFATINATRAQVSLTPFEFHALAALHIFKNKPLDIIILEVGLGGRLDAVNIIDADVAVITSIDLDHMDWLGKTREAIANEKAGIFRRHKPAVCGDMAPPETLIQQAKQLEAPLFVQGNDFFYTIKDDQWTWSAEAIDCYIDSLPLNSLNTQNMSTALMAVHLIGDRLPVSLTAIHKGLQNVSLPGRIQIIQGIVLEIHDVSHNPASVALLANRLIELPCDGRTYAVFSMLADKDIVASLNTIREQVDEWFVAPLNEKRGASAKTLVDAFNEARILHVHLGATIEESYRAAKKRAGPTDRIVVFGSFHTVARVVQSARACT